MDREDIREELLNRAREMRELPLELWVQGDPRNILNRIVECAVVRGCAGEMQRVLSVEAEKAVESYMHVHPELGTWTLTLYNDKEARSPEDVAILLEKVAADL